MDTEFRRIDKFIIPTNPVIRVVVTDNWIIQVGQWPWQFQMAHQSDVSLALVESEHHQISTEGQVNLHPYQLLVRSNNIAFCC